MTEQVAARQDRSLFLAPCRTAWCAGLSLLIASCGGGGGGSTTAAPAPVAATPAVATPTPTPTPTPQTSLNVVYVGGSVTVGAGATSAARGWAGLTTAWLRTKFTTVNERNIAVSGTDSTFGVHRLDQDIGGFVADLAFVEFGLNDLLLGREVSLANIDGIVHKLRQRNPRVRIVNVAVTAKLEESFRRGGTRYAGTNETEAFAALENIDFIDVGTPLWNRVLAGSSTLNSLFVDDFHPSDAGHQIYADAIRAALEPALPFTAQAARASSLYVSQTFLDTARLEPASLARGCRIGAGRGAYLEAPLECGLGDSFTVRFSGTSIGLVRSVKPDGGRLSCRLDGGAAKTLDFLDGEDATRTYLLPQMDFAFATNGTHDLACTVLAERPVARGVQSRGNSVVIGSFMVDAAVPLVR